MYKEEKVWNRYAPGYAKSQIGDEAAYQKKLEKTREYFTADSEVLEIGCGTGSTAILHASYVKHIHATDFSTKMIEIAKGKLEGQKLENLSFEHSSIDDLNIENQTMDVVLGLSIMHLLENKEEAAERIYKMLKPGGVFVTSTVCLGDTQGFFKFIAPIGKAMGLIPLVKVFKKQERINCLTDAGFDIDHEWHPGKGRAVFVVAKKGNS